VQFSVEGGELTPTMKLRRSEITRKYAARIAEFYADKDAAA
jgi:long-subunit acyl-CoA synthetase (AMP-forming)